MIARITIVDASFKSRIGTSSVDFAPGVNIIVGPNGSGKSSLLEALSAEIWTGDSKTARVIRDPSTEVLFYSGETATVKLSKADQPNPGDLTARHQSHGQGLRSYLAALEKLDGDHVVVMDEPETALDFMAVHDLCALIAQKAASGVQFIISSHHPLFLTMKSANVIALGDDPRYGEKVLKALKRRL